MTLAVNNNQDLFAYLTAVDSADSFSIPITSSLSGARTIFHWIQQEGVMQLRYTDAIFAEKYVRIDTSLVDSSSTAIFSFDPVVPLVYFMGDHQPAGSGQAQRMYSHNTNNDQETPVVEVDIVNPLIAINPAPFPNVGWGSQIPETDPPISQGDWFIDNLAGGTVYFAGQDGGPVLLCSMCDMFDAGSLKTRVMAEVNLNTGVATFLDGIKSFYDASGATEVWHGGPFLGQAADVEMQYIQFIPDDDSTHLNPKGILYQCSEATSGPPTTTHQYYMQFHEWNPNGAGGTPTRIHKELIQNTRATTVGNTSGTTILPGPPVTPENVVLGLTLTSNLRGQFLIFDTLRNVLVLPTSTSPYTSDDRNNAIIEFQNAAAVATLRKPQPLGAASTGRVVTFNTEVRGDLGEKIAGQNLSWTLEATSTEGELLSVGGSSPGDLIAVINTPVNTTDDYPRRVLKNALELTETVDFDFVSTGIQFIAPEPVSTETYLADYSHPAAPSAPPHGLLLTATSISDENGFSTARVEYADDPAIADSRDRLQVDS